MADDLLAIADIITDSLDLSPIEVQDVLNQAPFVSALPMVMSSNGDVHKYTKYTAEPVVGFRAENAGRDMDHGVDTAVTINLKILDWTFACDKAVADSDSRGADYQLMLRGRRHLQAALFRFEKQLLYGTGSPGDSGGHAGLADNAQIDAIADAMVVNATGTTANTGSSVFLIRAAQNGVAGVIHGDGFVMGDRTVVDMTDGDGKHFPAYYIPACTWTGLQIGSAYDAARIVNLTEDSGKGLTDDLLYQALSLFPAGYGPTHIVMSRRSLRQLRQSRTTYNPTGAPAPMPTELEGIPILVSEAVSNTEAILS